MYVSIVLLAQEQNGLGSKRESVSVSAWMGLVCVCAHEEVCEHVCV